MLEDGSIYFFESIPQEAGTVAVFGSAQVLTLGNSTNSASYAMYSQSPFTFGDVNGDGIDDAIFLSPQGEVSVRYGTGNKEFASASLALGFSSAQLAADVIYFNVVLADLRGDGLNHLLVSRNEDIFYLQNCQGRPSLFIEQQSFRAAGSPSNNVAVRGLGTADFGGGGMLDFFSVEGPHVFVHRHRLVSSWLVFQQEIVVPQTVDDVMLPLVYGAKLVLAYKSARVLYWARPIGRNTTSLPFEPTAIAYGGASLGVVLGSEVGSVAYVPDRDEGGYSSVVLIANGTLPAGEQLVQCGDVTGSGFIDVVTAIGEAVYVNETLTYTATASGAIVSLALGDMNRDGRLDIVVATQKVGAEMVMIFYGGSTTATAVWSSFTQVNPTLNRLDILVTDLDSDGRQDIVVSTQRAGYLGVLYGKSTTDVSGTFVSATAVVLESASPAVRVLGVADTTNRGHMDIFFVYEDERQVYFLPHSDKSREFLTVQPIAPISKGHVLHAVALMDYNTDRSIDFIHVSCSTATAACDAVMTPSGRDALKPMTVRVERQAGTEARSVRSPCLDDDAAPCWSLEVALSDHFRFKPGGAMIIDLSNGTHFISEFVNLEAYRARRIIVRVPDEGATLDCSNTGAVTFLDPCVRLRSGKDRVKSAISFTGGPFTVSGFHKPRRTPLVGIDGASSLSLGAHVFAFCSQDASIVVPVPCVTGPVPASTTDQPVWLRVQGATLIPGGELSLWEGGLLSIRNSQDVSVFNVDASDSRCLDFGAGLAIDASTDVTCANFRLSDMGGAAVYGGAVYVRASDDIELRDSIISDAKAISGGGCFAATTSARVRLINVAMQACSAKTTGGAVTDSEARSILSMLNVDIYNSSVTGSGGGSGGGGVGLKASHAVMRSDTKATLSQQHIHSRFPYEVGRCAVRTCSAEFGGAVYSSESGSVNIQAGCRLEHNHATRDGGAVYIEGGTMTLTEVQVVANSADDNGGALASVFGAIRLTDIIISANTAGENGGGVHCIGSSSSGELNVHGGSVTWSVAVNGDGGAIYTRSCRVATSDVALRHNRAVYGSGGGMAATYVESDQLTFYLGPKTHFINNTAARDGGALLIAAPDTLQASFENVAFGLNSAPFGGGGAVMWRADRGRGWDIPGLFVQNTAAYGPDRATPARALALLDTPFVLPPHASRAPLSDVQLLVSVRDLYGQLVTTDWASSVRVSSSGQLIGTVDVPVRGGIANFTNLLAVEAPPFSTATLTFQQPELENATVQVLLPVRPCEAGEFVEDGLRCRPCSAGTYTPSEGNTKCLPCHRGQFQPLNGQSKCNTCRPGEFSPESGTFGVESCTKCPPGTFAGSAGLSVCISCAAGKKMPLSQSMNQSACVDCIPGYFSSIQGAVECSPCAPGRARPANTSADTCILCDPGTYQPNEAQVTCLPCGVGRAMPSYGQVDCLSCNPGLAAPRKAMHSCETCQAGRFSAAAEAVNCSLCAPGTFSAFNNSANCVPCAAGKYAPVPGLTACEACPPGSFAPRDSASSCEACPPFSRQPLPGQPACAFCPDESYLLVDECVQCPSGAVCVSGRAPFAQEGFYLAAPTPTSPMESFACTSGRCVACDGPDATQTVQCCSSNRAPASSNVLCGACLDGYFEWGGDCVFCSSTNGAAVALLFLALWAYVVLIHVLSQQQGGSAAIVFYFLQICSLSVGSDESIGALFLFVDFNVLEAAGGQCVAPLSPLQKTVLRLCIPLICLGFLLLTMLLHAVAIWRLSKRSDGADGQEFAPSSSSFRLSLRAMSHLAAEHDMTVRDVLSMIRLAYFRTFLSLLLFSYNSTTTTVFTSLDCTSVLGERVVRTEPAISCTSAAYQRALVLYVLLLVVVVVLFPLVLLWWLRRRNAALVHASASRERHSTVQESMFGSPRGAAVNDVDGGGGGGGEVRVVEDGDGDGGGDVDPYGVLYEPFRDERYYWQVVILARRAILISASLLFAERREMKFTVMGSLHLLSLHSHLLLRPYKLASDNHFEAVFLTLLAAISLLLLPTDSTARLSPSRAAVIGVLVYVPTALFVGFLITRKGWRIMIGAAFSRKAGTGRRSTIRKSISQAMGAKEAVMELEMAPVAAEQEPGGYLDSDDGSDDGGGGDGGGGGEVWERFETDEGIPYWHNPATNESRWIEPK